MIDKKYLMYNKHLGKQLFLKNILLHITPMHLSI